MSCYSIEKRKWLSYTEVQRELIQPFERGRRGEVMLNVLVCDDDKEIVDAIEIYLSQEGYRILKAYDGIQALTIMKKEEIHLLILDIMMPRMDGIRATLKDQGGEQTYRSLCCPRSRRIRIRSWD